MIPEVRQCRWVFQKEKMFATSWLWWVLSLKTTQGRQRGRIQRLCYIPGAGQGQPGDGISVPFTVTRVKLQSGCSRTQPDEPVGSSPAEPLYPNPCVGLGCIIPCCLPFPDPSLHIKTEGKGVSLALDTTNGGGIFLLNNAGENLRSAGHNSKLTFFWTSYNKCRQMFNVS